MISVFLIQFVFFWNLNAVRLPCYFTPISYAGIVHPAYNVSPDFDTLNYKFHSASYALLAESRWFLPCNQLTPFLFLGLGAARNHSYKYSEIPSDPNLTAAPMLFPFADHWNTNFSYGLGFGMAKMMKEKLKWAIEYRYLNLGSTELGLTPAQTVGKHLNIDPLRMNMIILSFYLN